MSVPGSDPRKKDKPGPLEANKTNEGNNTNDDVLAETNPSDSRLDEKVIVNEQVSGKIVNSPSQTMAHPGEGENIVDDL